MQQRASEHAAAAAPNLGELLENALRHTKSLVQAELSLARRELSDEISSAFGAIGLFVAGAMCLQAALITLGLLLALAFGVGVVGAVVVVLWAGVGAALCVFGKRALGRRRLPRTTARLALDAQQVIEAVK